MLFNSYVFLLFLPLAFAIYWLIGRERLRGQNFFILVASYIFYGWWDYRFLSLIVISSIVDYVVGLKMHGEERENKRKLLLWISMGVNLGFLGFFKYFNFFIDSFADMVSMFGMQPNIPSLQVILPVGISFYTFQTMSYTIDIYRREMEPTKDWIGFFAFVGFFPQLVAGPIERAKRLLPQFFVKREFDYDRAVDGMRQALWGFFKKVVVADTVAGVVNQTFAGSEEMSAPQLILGVFFFAIQIYCDFSGYSDIAIGIARLFGFDSMRNFAYPYFSRDIGEFWRRWHISLSSWFRDYVYIPLGGSRVSKGRRIWNIVVTFTVSGFWHGANWTFVVWGFLNGAYYIPLMLRNKQKQHTDTIAENKWYPSLGEIFGVAVTFSVTLIAWVFFRAENITHALNYIAGFVTHPWTAAGLIGIRYLPLVFVMLGVEWFNRKKQHGLQIGELPTVVRWGAYWAVGLFILAYFGGEQTFIYFQF
ncbi:MAG: MBOAT family protein [Ignavibacteriales bacterium]|nr:MBOAT family protein [Ignavibacteriales bacterium]